MTNEEWSDLFYKICQQFNRDMDADLAAEWLDQLEQRLSDAEIRAGVRQVIYANKYWPSIKEVVDASRGDEEERALEQWEFCHQIMQDSRRADSVLEKMDAEGQRVVRMMGGVRQLTRTKLDEVQWRRKEFLNLYGSAAEAAERDQLPPMTDEGRQQLRDATSGTGLLE